MIAACPRYRIGVAKFPADGARLRCALRGGLPREPTALELTFALDVNNNIASNQAHFGS